MKNLSTTYKLLIIIVFIGNSSCSDKIFPVIKMNTIPKEIYLGDSVVFKWRALKTSQLILKPTNDTIDTSGTITVKPKNDSTVTYKFIAYNGKNKATKTFTIKVISPVIKAEIPPTVDDENEFEVKWDATYADYVTLSLCSEKLPVKGTKKVKADSTEKITFTAFNQFVKSMSKTYPLLVNYIENLKFPEILRKGDSCYISWKYKKTKKVWVDGFDKPFNPIDSVCVKPLADKKYMIKAVRNNKDTVKQEAAIKVIYPALLSFSGPGYIFKGNDATLKWTSHLVPLVNIEGVKDSLTPNGSIVVKPIKTTNYKLTAIFNGEKQWLNACVNVIQRRLVIDSRSINDSPPNMRFDFEIFASDFSHYPEYVKLYVLVVDTLGNFITGLAPPFGKKEIAEKYFKNIVENSSSVKNHNVQSFDVKEVHEKKDIPEDINITLDYSGSMMGVTNTLEKSVELFVNKMPPKLDVSLVRFSDTIVKVNDLTSNKEELLKHVFLNPKADTFYFKGTALYAAMDEGLISLENAKNQKQMIAFTDGYENSSFAYIGKRATFAQQIAKKAKEMNVRINTIGYGAGTNETVLKFLAIITGGTYYSILRPSDMMDVMNECFYLHRNYYVITYKTCEMKDSCNITLVYNSNNGKTGSASRDVFVGNNFNLQDLDMQGTGNNYWYNKSKWGKLSPVSLPQSVANFDFAMSDLKPIYLKKINPFVEYLKKNTSSKIIIYGHADHVGNEADCENLSKLRALSVKEYMVKSRIPESQIMIEACGKKHPIWNVENAAWKANENRRVELLIIQ